VDPTRQEHIHIQGMAISTLSNINIMDSNPSLKKQFLKNLLMVLMQYHSAQIIKKLY
jgi:hypothetical protein